MDALRILVVATLMVAAPARADPIDRWRAHIAEASARFGIPVIWIERVMRAESAGMTVLNGRPITSRAGAMGLMQLMPGTWADMRARLGLGDDPHDPRENILAGTAYLRLMYDRFGYPGMFAAYNAGPARFARHLATGNPLPSETRTYLVQVTAGSADTTGSNTSWANRIFFTVSTKTAEDAESAREAASGDIFVMLGTLVGPDSGH